jgi:hypothetical protein
MGDLRPLGSEKLQGMDKINRMIEIARYNEVPKNEINELSTTNYTIRLSDGNVYAIVKEKLGYIIKSGLNESTLDYSDTIRHRKYHRSYSEAMKKLNLMVSEVNRNNGFEENVALIGEQTDTKKKFILKTPKPKTDVAAPPMDVATPPPAPASPDTTMAPPADDMGMTPPPVDDMAMPPVDDMAMPPADDMGSTPPSDDMGMPPADDMGMPPADDMGDDISDEDDEEQQQGPMGLKSIQKLTGRLSQKIRAFDKEKGLDSQDIKYVLNSIISALDLENLDEDDKDDVLSKFDESDEYGEEGSGDLDFEGDDMDMGMGETPEEMPQPPVTESSVDRVLKGYFNIKNNEKPLLEEKRKRDFLKNKLNKLSVKSEIESLSESNVQSEKALSILENYKNAKFIGKTNKENLIFVIEGKQYKVTPIGRIL